GGEIVRDASGRASGLLRETAQRLASAARSRAESNTTAEEREAMARRVVQLAAEDALSKGITTFHDAGTGFSSIDLFRTMADEGSLPIRLNVMVRGESLASMDSLLSRYRMIDYANG